MVDDGPPDTQAPHGPVALLGGPYPPGYDTMAGAASVPPRWHAQTRVESRPALETAPPTAKAELPDGCSRNPRAGQRNTIIVFGDKTYWFQGTRRIVTAPKHRRTIHSSGGLTTLPPGKYLLAARPTHRTGRAEFDSAFLAQIVSAAVLVTLGPGEKKIKIRDPLTDVSPVVTHVVPTPHSCLSTVTGSTLVARLAGR